MLSNAVSFALWDGPAVDRGEAGAFCIQTGSDFTYEEATISMFSYRPTESGWAPTQTDNFILGLGLSTTGRFKGSCMDRGPTNKSKEKFS
jgi:hypothetical protein